MMNEGKRTVIAYWEEPGWEHGLLWGRCARLVESATRLNKLSTYRQVKLTTVFRVELVLQSQPTVTFQYSDSRQSSGEGAKG
jgi:hypothetical protein